MLSRLDPRNEGGFLLLDLLTATLMLAIVFGAFAALLAMLQRRDNTLQTQAVLAAEARPVLDTIAAELESATCNGTTQPIAAASGTQVVFAAPDRQQPYHLQQISFTLAGGTLSRQVALSTNTSTTGPPWTLGPVRNSTIVEAVTNPVVFRFFDSTGAPLPSASGSANGVALSATDLPKIAKVTVTVVAVPPTSNGTGSLTAQSSASLRTPTCN